MKFEHSPNVKHPAVNYIVLLLAGGGQSPKYSDLYKNTTLLIANRFAEFK
jgi:hypothetical protein